MKAMHSPPGQHEVLLTNGSNHALEVGRGTTHQQAFPFAYLIILLQSATHARRKQLYKLHPPHTVIVADGMRIVVGAW